MIISDIDYIELFDCTKLKGGILDLGITKAPDFSDMLREALQSQYIITVEPQCKFERAGTCLEEIPWAAIIELSEIN